MATAGFVARREVGRQAWNADERMGVSAAPPPSAGGAQPLRDYGARLSRLAHEVRPPAGRGGGFRYPAGVSTGVRRS